MVVTTDFSEYAIGAQPGDFDRPWDSTAAWSVQADVTALSGKYLRKDTSGFYDLLQWLDVPAHDPTQPMRFLVCGRLPSATAVGNRSVGVYLHTTGSGNSGATGASFAFSTTAVSIGHLVSGTFTSSVSSAVALPSDTWIWMRGEVLSRTSGRVKVWTGNAWDEPAGGWVNTPAGMVPFPADLGRAGLNTFQNRRGHYCWFSVATGTDQPARPMAAPVAGFTHEMDFLTVTCTSIASDVDGGIATIEYDYGDGSGYVAAPSHTYTEFGAYTITQRVTDVDGLQATDAAEVTTGSAGRAAAPEFALWASGEFVPHLDVQIERVIGGVPTFQSYRDFGGWNWIRSLRLTPAQVDTPIGSGTLTLHRQRGSANLSPLVIGSSLNQDGGVYSPALDFGREIRILVALTPTDTTVVTTAPVLVNAETVDVAALGKPIGAGSLLHFPQGTVRTLTDADAGAVILDVAPVPAAIPAGTPAPVSHEPAPGEWRQLFEGLTDDPQWGGKDRPTVEVPFRDRAGSMADTYPRATKVYGATEGVPLMEVAQEIADDWMGAGQYPLEAWPEAPAFMVTLYEINEERSVWEALESLADQAGAVFRQTWNEAAGEERITCITPPRDKVDPDYAVGPGTYLEVHSITTGGQNLRNIVRVLAVDGESGEDLEYQVPEEEDVATDPSVLQYGPRFMQIPEEEASAIDTQAELVAFGDAIYADVSSPPIPLEPETRLCWFAAPDQVVRWMANTILWDAYQDAAVMGVSHEFPAPGVARTRWRCAGRPKGAYAAHTRKGVPIAGRNARPPRAAGFYELTRLRLDEEAETATQVALVWDQGPGVEGVEGAAVLFLSGGPSETEVRDAVANAAAAVVQPLMITKPSRWPQFALARLQPWWTGADSTVQYGAVEWFVVDPPAGFAARILSLDVTDQRIRAVGENAMSWRAERLNAPGGGEWMEDQDGGGAVFAVPVPAAETWEVEITAYNDPTADRDTDTLSVAEPRVVRGSAVSTADVWATMSATAPADGDTSVAISITAAAAPPAGLSTSIWARSTTGESGAVEWFDITGDVVPAMVAPAAGVTQNTVYDVSGFFTRSATGTTPVVWEFRVEARDAGALVDAEARTASWYVDAEEPL